MHALDRHVGGENYLLPGRGGYQGGVIADAQGKARHAPRGPAAYPGNKVRFALEKRLVTHEPLVARAGRLSASHLSLNLGGRGIVHGVYERVVCLSRSIGMEYALRMGAPPQRVGDL